MATAKLVTPEDLYELDDDVAKYDLIDGVLYRMAPPGGDHGYTTVRLTSRLAIFVDRYGLGRVYAETTYVLARDPATALTPDASFVRSERIIPPDHEKFLEQAPDIAVEVRSPSNSLPLIARKMERYLAHGVRLGWTVDPSRKSVTVYEPDNPPRMLANGDVLDGGDVLPGFELPLRDLFDL